jgi:hypothetical protein
MKKLFFALVVVMCCVFTAQGQSTYKSAIGLRLGYPAAVSYKHFLNEKGAIEAFVGFRGYGLGRSINFGAMYEHHTPITSVEGLQWYVGGGAGAWLWSWNNGFDPGPDYGGVNITIMACGGLDYKFADLPLNLSVDWVPTFVLGDSYYSAGFGFGYGALSARYTLN